MCYVNGHSWATVGEKAGYSEVHCKELRSEALTFAHEVMPYEWRTMIPRAD